MPGEPEHGPDGTVSQEITGSTITGPVYQVGYVGGDLVIGDEARFRIRAVASDPSPAETALAQESPSILLRAKYQTVPFIGREPQLAELSAWLTAGSRRSVRLIHGPGGQGKTRLLTVFARRCLDAGWAVWQAGQASEAAAGGNAKPGEPGGVPGLLVLVDYAERWPLPDLLRLVNHRALQPACPVRILLAARPAGTWWTSLLAELEELDVGGKAVNLPPLGEQVSPREMFAAARDSFAAALGVTGVAGIAPPPALDAGARPTVLAVHMAALAAVDAHRNGVPAPTEAARISGYLLNREQMQWRRLCERGTIRTAGQVMRQAVFTAVLTRPLPYRLGVQALSGAGVTSTTEGARQVLTDHALCYPPGDQSTVLEPLYPDRLGEDFLALQTPGHGLDGYDPDPWAADAIDMLMAPSEGQAAPAWARQAVTVLIAAAERWPHLRRTAQEVLQRRPQLAIDAGGAALTALAELPGTGISLLEAIEARFPPGPSIDLDAGIAAVAVRLTEHRLAATDDPAEQAALLNALCLRLANAGNKPDALAVSWAVVAKYRELAERDPAAFEPELGGALAELGTLLADQDWQTACAATEEAVEIFGRLTEADPAGYEPRLAMALNDLGNRLGDLGKTQQAVEIFQRLAEADPAAYEPRLAVSLSNLAIRLSESGRSREALEANQKATGILTRLAETDAGYEPQLAMSLNNLGMMLASPEESLEVTQRAVEIARRLAAANPAAYQPQLAVLLSNLALRLADLRRGSEALQAARDAISVYEQLAESGTVGVEPRLAKALLDFAKLCVAEQAQLPSALEAVTKSIEIYRMMPYTQRGLVMTDFEQVGALFTQADVLAGLGRADEAERIRKSLTGNGWRRP